MDDTFRDTVSHAGHANSLDTCRCEHIYFAPEASLQVFDQFNKLELDWSLKFDHNVDIASFAQGPLGEGPKQANTSHAVLGGEIGIAIQKPRGNLLGVCDVNPRRNRRTPA